MLNGVKHLYVASLADPGAEILRCAQDDTLLGVPTQAINRASFCTTWPDFITNATRWSSVTSCTGSP